jgi:ketosteroid isomerase-like protein
MSSAHERDPLFKAFGRAFFKRDVAQLYEVVTSDFVWATHDGESVSHVTGREAVGRQLEHLARSRTGTRFHDVVYHHAPEATFMTFRLTATDAATGRPIEAEGVERYTFRDGRIALKDVYLKPATGAGEKE